MNLLVRVEFWIEKQAEVVRSQRKAALFPLSEAGPWGALKLIKTGKTRIVVGVHQ